MSIFLNILFLILGMAFLIKGADIFVSGASAVAKKFKVPALFIGLTIVALGTSLPELSVSIASAVKQNVDMSVGNIVGSNMMNMLLIFGITILIKPVTVKSSSKKLDFPFLIAITLLLLLLSVDTIINGDSQNLITRSESIIFIATIIGYITISILLAKQERKQNIFKTDNMQFSVDTNDDTSIIKMKNNEIASTEQNDNKIENPNNENESERINIENESDKNNIIKFKKEKKSKLKKNKNEKMLKNWQIVIFIILGLAGVIFGAECVSTTAQFLALKIGMSEALVGITVVAIGTSLPELATSISASLKGENELALGNILGSNIMNIALILGTVGLITQIQVSSLILIDILILFVCTIIFSIICMSKKNLGRIIGFIFVMMYVAYMTFAIVRNYCF